VPPQNLPATIVEFISHHIHSVEQLEVLVLLHGDPQKRWSAKRVYDVVLSAPQSVQRWLDDLTRRGLIQKPPDDSDGYQASPDDSVRSQVAQLAECYRLTPVRVIEAIYRRESSAVQSFADAFKLKNPDKP
jgi:hypothetical protein